MRAIVILLIISGFTVLTVAAYRYRQPDELSGKCHYIRTHCKFADVAWDPETNREVQVYSCTYGQILTAVCEDMP